MESRDIAFRQKRSVRPIFVEVIEKTTEPSQMNDQFSYKIFAQPVSDDFQRECK